MISKTFYLFIWPSRQNNHVNPQASLTCYWPPHTQSVGSCPDFLRILSLIAFWIECSRSGGGDRLCCKGGLRTWSEEPHQNPGGHSCDSRDEGAELFHQLSSKSRGRKERKAFSDRCPHFPSPTAVVCKQDKLIWWVQHPSHRKIWTSSTFCHEGAAMPRKGPDLRWFIIPL